MRDAGDHVFEYALTAYDEPFADSQVVLDAERYNRGYAVAVGRVVSGMPNLCLRSDNVRLTAVKRAEDGVGLALRLAEYRGQAGKAVLSLPADVTTAARVNLLERETRPLTTRNGKVTLALRPWEIATVRVQVL